jgi:hypothetical protein
MKRELQKPVPRVVLTVPMVAAGVEVLWQSGAVEGRLGSDELLVAEIFAAMVGAMPRSNRHM